MKFLSLVLGFLFLAAAGVIAQTTNELEGQKLVQDILREAPTENTTQKGTLRIRNLNGTTNYPVKFETFASPTSWSTKYTATLLYVTNGPVEQMHLEIITVRHTDSGTNSYEEDSSTIFYQPEAGIMSPRGSERDLPKQRIMTPFANSDFWIADLGLEFFHWPQQKILRHESKKTRACTVLESTNPNPTPGAYSRVVTWIDNESHAIIYAEAYDVDNKLLKEFNPKKVKKVNGQWELEEMDIRNVQTKSRTWITFDLSGKS